MLAFERRTLKMIYPMHAFKMIQALERQHVDYPGSHVGEPCQEFRVVFLLPLR